MIILNGGCIVSLTCSASMQLFLMDAFAQEHFRISFTDKRQIIWRSFRLLHWIHYYYLRTQQTRSWTPRQLNKKNRILSKYHRHYMDLVVTSIFTCITRSDRISRLEQSHKLYVQSIEFYRYATTSTRNINHRIVNVVILNLPKCILPPSSTSQRVVEPQANLPQAIGSYYRRLCFPILKIDLSFYIYTCTVFARLIRDPRIQQQYSEPSARTLSRRSRRASVRQQLQLMCNAKISPWSPHQLVELSGRPPFVCCVYLSCKQALASSLQISISCIVRGVPFQNRLVLPVCVPRVFLHSKPVLWSLDTHRQIRSVMCSQASRGSLKIRFSCVTVHRRCFYAIARSCVEDTKLS